MTRFDSTHWSIVLRAGGKTADARAALDQLCRTYRPPVLAYVRSRGYGADAEDLAQAFFARFIANAGHSSADPARGRFRALLLTSLKHFLANARVEARAVKRGGAVEFAALVEDDQPDDALTDSNTPEYEFERNWALAALDAAMRRLRGEAEEAGKLPLFETLREFLAEHPERADYSRAAAKLNLRRNTVAVAVHRLRSRLRELVRAELAQTTAARADLELELRELRGALGSVLHSPGLGGTGR